MDPHPLPARAVVAFALLGACGDDLMPEVPPATVEVAAIPGLPTKQIDVAIVVSTADPAPLAAALPSVLKPMCDAFGFGDLRVEVIDATGAVVATTVGGGGAPACLDLPRVMAIVSAAPPGNGGAVIQALRTGVAAIGFRRPGAELVEIIATDADDTSPDDLAEAAHALGADDARFAAIVIADPASPRLSALAAAFGAHGWIVPPAADLAPGLAAASLAIPQLAGRACLDATDLLDAGLEGGLQPLCFAVELRDGVTSDLPECPHEGDCFALINDDYACPHVPDYLRVSVNFVTAPTTTTAARVRCELP